MPRAATVRPMAGRPACHRSSEPESVGLPISRQKEIECRIVEHLTTQSQHLIPALWQILEKRFFIPAIFKVHYRLREIEDRGSVSAIVDAFGAEIRSPNFPLWDGVHQGLPAPIRRLEKTNRGRLYLESDLVSLLKCEILEAMRKDSGFQGAIQEWRNTPRTFPQMSCYLLLPYLAPPTLLPGFENQVLEEAIYQAFLPLIEKQDSPLRALLTSHVKDRPTLLKVRFSLFRNPRSAAGHWMVFFDEVDRSAYANAKAISGPHRHLVHGSRLRKVPETPLNFSDWEARKKVFAAFVGALHDDVGLQRAVHDWLTFHQENPSARFGCYWYVYVD